MTDSTLDAACTELLANTRPRPVVWRAPLVSALDQAAAGAHWYVDRRVPFCTATFRVDFKSC